MASARGFIYICGILALCLTLVNGEGIDITGTIELEGVGPRGSTLKAKVNLHVAGGSISGGKEKKEGDCQPLKQLLIDFVYTNDWETAKLILIKNRNIRDNMTEAWQWMYRQTGFNFTDGVTRDRLACLFYDASEGSHAATKELAPVYDSLQIYYINTFKPIILAYDYDFDKMQDVITVFREFANWREMTGFPDVPMENLQQRRELEQLFRTWRRRLNIKGSSSMEHNTKYFLEMVGFPNLMIDPAFVAKTLLNPGSTKELLRNFGIGSHVYDNMQTVGTPLAVDALAQLFSRFFSILEALNYIGMLPT